MMRFCDEEKKIETESDKISGADAFSLDFYFLILRYFQKNKGNSFFFVVKIFPPCKLLEFVSPLWYALIQRGFYEKIFRARELTKLRYGLLSVHLFDVEGK